MNTKSIALVRLPFFLLVSLLLHVSTGFSTNTSGHAIVCDDVSSTPFDTVTWTADINEYEYNSSPLTWLLRIEFNYVQFIGQSGQHAVGAMIQNNSQDFQNDVVGSRFAPLSNMTSNWGIGLYFTSLRDDWADSKHGVELLANPSSFPNFGRIFEDVDALGLVGKNIYSRIPTLGNPAVDGKITVKWTVSKNGIVTNPVGNFSKDKNGNWVALVGTFVKWKFNVEINGVSIDVANYYLPIEYAESLRGTSPITLNQEHFGGAYNALNLNKTHVKYYNMLASNSTVTDFELRNWRLYHKIEDDPMVTDKRVGWYSDCNSLHSVCGHEQDATQTGQTIGNTFKTAAQKVPVPQIVGLKASYCSSEPTVTFSGNYPYGSFYIDTEYMPSTGFTPSSLSPGNHTVRYEFSYYPTCTVADTQSFFIVPAPKAYTGGDVYITPGQNATLSATPSLVSYQWNTGATTPSIVVSPSVKTTYSVKAQGTNGCFDTSFMTVYINENTGIVIDSITTTPDKCNQEGKMSIYAHGGYKAILGSVSGKYEFTGTSNPDTDRRNATVYGMLTTFSPVTSPNLLSTPYANELRLKGWNVGSTNTSPYIEFGINAPLGKSLQFKTSPIIQLSAQLTFKIKSNATEQFDQYKVMYSVDGGAWTYLGGNKVPDVYCASMFPNPANAPLTFGTCTTQDSKAEIIFDATGTKLAGQSQLYVYAGYNGWKGVPSSWTNTAQLIKCENLGNNKHKVTFSPSMREYFKTTSYVTELDIIFRNQAGNLQTPDYKIAISGGQDPIFESHSFLLPAVTTQEGGNVKFRIVVEGASSEPHTYIAFDDIYLTSQVLGSELKYCWSKDNCQGQSTISYLKGGDYTVSVTDILGNFVTKKVTVPASVVPVANAGADQFVCAGQTATLSAVAPTSPFIYLWSNGVQGNTISVTPVTTSTFTLSVADGLCVGKDTVVVTVKPLPIAVIDTVAPVCKGEYASLTATGGWGFDWSTGQWTAGQPISTIYVTPLTTSTYTVTVWHNGCTDSQDVVVVVKDVPVISGITTSDDKCNNQGEMTISVLGNTEKVTPFTGVYTFTGDGPSHERAEVISQPIGATFGKIDIPGLASLAKKDKYRTDMWNTTSTYNENEYMSFKLTADADKKIRLTTADEFSFQLSTNAISAADKLRISYRIDSGEWIPYTTMNIVDGVCNSWTSNNSSISLSQACINKDELFFVYFKAQTYGGAVSNINTEDMYVYSGYNNWKGVPTSWNSTNELIHAQYTSPINKLYTYSYNPTVNGYFKTTDQISSIQLIMRNKAGNVQTGNIQVTIQNNGVASEIVYHAPIPTAIETAVGGSIEFRIQAINVADESRELVFDNLSLTGRVVSTESDYSFNVEDNIQEIGYYTNLSAGTYVAKVTSTKTGCSASQQAVVASGCSVAPSITTAPTNKPTVSSLSSTMANASLVFYPNPTTELMYVELEGMGDQVTLVIYAMDGKKVYHSVLDGASQEAHKVDVSTLTAGVYMISVIGEKETINKQLIIE